MFLFCLVFAMFCARLFICAFWSPAGKGLTSWLSFVVSSVSLSLSHWYPGSGVVLDCIDSWSLHHYLLLWPLICEWKMVSRLYHLNTAMYWIHISYTGIWSIKYRPSSITDKIHQLLSELWPLISVWKMVSRRYLLNTLVYWIHISYTGIWSWNTGQVRSRIQSTDYYQSFGPLLMTMPYLCEFGNSGGIRVPWTHF